MGQPALKTVFTSKTHNLHQVNGSMLLEDRRIERMALCLVREKNTGQLVLGERFRPAIGGYSWEGIRAEREPTETIQKAIISTIFDEFGVDCDEEDVVRIGQVAQDPSVILGSIPVFVATFRLVRHLESDHKAIRRLQRFSIQQALQMGLSGEITDAATMAALALLSAAEEGRKSTPSESSESED